VTMHVHGTGFTESSVIYFANQPEPIVFVSAEEITTVITLSLPWGAVTVPVWVQNGAEQSNELSFTFTEAAVTPEENPLGPFTILHVEDHADGLQVELADTSALRTGDTVLVEATGNTSVNGTYTVLEIIGNVVIIDNDFELPTPIEAKGRLTITNA
jgi:hypothetical protein